jgi:hypothetical protein
MATDGACGAAWTFASPKMFFTDVNNHTCPVSLPNSHQFYNTFISRTSTGDTSFSDAVASLTSCWGIFCRGAHCSESNIELIQECWEDDCQLTNGDDGEHYPRYSHTLQDNLHPRVDLGKVIVSGRVLYTHTVALYLENLRQWVVSLNEPLGEQNVSDASLGAHSKNAWLIDVLGGDT